MCRLFLSGVFASHSLCLVINGERREGDGDANFPFGDAPNSRLGEGSERSLLSKKTDGEKGGLFIGDDGGGDMGTVPSLPFGGEDDVVGLVFLLFGVL